MSALTTDTTIKGNGLRFDVRSYKLFRSLDFSLAQLGSSPYYEIGNLPDGFVPRNIAIIELTRASSAATLAVYAKSDSAKLVERTLGTAAGITVAAAQGATNTVTQSSESPYAVSAVTTVLGAGHRGETLCVKLSADSPASGKVKIVISGDLMTDVWDEGDKTGDITPASTVLTNMND